MASWCLLPVQISCVRVSYSLKVNSQYFVRNVRGQVNIAKVLSAAPGAR